MRISIYASKAEVGQKYVSKRGNPVTVLSTGNIVFGRPGIIVRNDLTGDKVTLFADQLLWPYDAKLISKEAMNMAKAKTEGSKKGGMRGGERGARKEKDGIILFRKIGIVMHEVLCHEGVLTYRTKDYMTLKEVAAVIRGKAISGSGRSFFGLRTQGNIELGKEVIKHLTDMDDAKKAVMKAEEEKYAAQQKKEKKLKAKKAEDDEDEDESKPKSVADVVAKVMGRGKR